MPGPRLPSRLRSRLGFSLIELLIAAAVLVIAILGLMATMTYSTRADVVSQETIVAMHSARAKLEEIQAGTSVATIQATYNNNNFAVPGLVARANDADRMPGRVVITASTVAPTAPSAAQTVLDVRVIIEWTGVFGDQSYVAAMKVANH